MRIQSGQYFVLDALLLFCYPMLWQPILAIKALSEVVVMAKGKQPAEVKAEGFWEDRAKLLRVMAHPVRLLILETLCEQPHCVKHLNYLISIPQPHLSQHMAALRKEDLIACHACGPVRCYYVLRPTLVRRIIRLLRQEHPPKQRSARSVVRESRRGWAEEMETGCREDSPASEVQRA